VPEHVPVPVVVLAGGVAATYPGSPGSMGLSSLHPEKNNAATINRCVKFSGFIAPKVLNFN